MTASTLERRAFALDSCKIETRSEGGGQPKIFGHAAIFDSLSENLGGFRELIKPGAFTKAVQQDDIRALFNHNADHILGRNKSGTLALSEDGRGLAIEITPPDTTIGRDVLKSIERGDISQMSFGFTVRAGGEQWTEDENGDTIRILSDLKLFDVSPVTFPAYPQTDVAVRSLTDYRTRQVDQANQPNKTGNLEHYKRRLRVLELSQ